MWEEIVGESNDKQRGQSHWVCIYQSVEVIKPTLN